MAAGASTEVAPSSAEGADKPEKKPTWRAVRDAFAGAVAPVGGFINSLGEHIILLFKSGFWLFRGPFRMRLFAESAEFVGIGSLPIIILVGGFTGAVTALQAVTAFALLQSEAYSGMAVGLSLAVELAPVLTALMLAGRAGSGIATELGTMRITEQIDALETMAVSPIQYLVTPRVLAGILMTPILTMIFFMIGMVGAYVVAVILMHVDGGQFIENFKWFVDPVDIEQGLIKSVIFGMVVTLIGSYQGYNASGGGKGVGQATTRAVVVGSVAILVLDYFLSDVLYVILKR
jgi:phospholipid/cholesterol/gamma-HCH transport system permease protein